MSRQDVPRSPVQLMIGVGPFALALGAQAAKKGLSVVEVPLGYRPAAPLHP